MAGGMIFPHLLSPPPKKASSFPYTCYLVMTVFTCLESHFATRRWRTQAFRHEENRLFTKSRAQLQKHTVPVRRDRGGWPEARGGGGRAPGTPRCRPCTGSSGCRAADRPRSCRACKGKKWHKIWESGTPRAGARHAAWKCRCQPPSP